MKLLIGLFCILSMFACTRSQNKTDAIGSAKNNIEAAGQAMKVDQEKSKDMMAETGELAARMKAYNDCLEKSTADNALEECEKVKAEPVATPTATPEVEQK